MGTVERPAPLVALFAATRAELAGAFRAVQSPSPVMVKTPAAVRGFLYGAETVVVQTGMGPERATAAVGEVLQKADISEVLLTGFAGGLDPRLQAGDLVLCTEAVDAAAEGKLPRRLGADERLLRRARSSGLCLAESVTLTVDHLVGTVEEKRRLRRKWRAGLVDMETHRVVAASAKLGLPVLAVRAVLDAAEDELAFWTPLLTPRGGLRPLRLVSRLVRQPKAILALIDLHRRARICQEALDAFVARYFTLLRREPEEAVPDIHTPASVKEGRAT